MDLVLIALVTGTFFGWALWQGRRVRAALKAEISDDSCVACESSDVSRLGLGRYACRACGYEGGSGQAAHQQDLRHQALEALSPEQRRDSVSRLLEDAQLLLLAAEGSLEEAQKLGRLDIVGVGGEHTLEQGLNDKRAALLRGIREQTEARAVLADIAPFVRGADDLGAKELPDLLWVTDFYLDNAVSDLLLQRRISQAIQSTSELRSATRELIAA